MIKVEINEVMGIYSAICGMRNSFDSWKNGDTILNEEFMCDLDGCPGFSIDAMKSGVTVGENDKTLARKLIDAGPSHRKFMRQIFVSMNITAPLYWWKEFDTYKVGTTANSCSTMHTITNREFEIDDFSHDKMLLGAQRSLTNVVWYLNALRSKYLDEEDQDVKKKYWYSIIQLLPSSYNQLRTVTMSYENLKNMYEQRKSHKLDEWRDFCNTIEKVLPYSNWITDKKENEGND